MYSNCNKLIHCFRRWQQLSLTFSREDHKLRFYVNLIAGLLLTSGILENLCSHWKMVAVPGNEPIPWDPTRNRQTASVWEAYWWMHFYHKVKTVVPYNTVLSVSLFFFNKWCLYAWNFGDILISVLALAIYRKFKLNYEAAADACESIQVSAVNNDNSGDGPLYKRISSTPGEFWGDLVEDHGKLTNLLDMFNEVLSPLVFCCSATNIFFVSLTLYNFFESTATPDDTGREKFMWDNIDLSDYLLWHQFYVSWAFFHLLVRTFITLACCARVNEYAHKMTTLLEKCPSHLWNRNVERLEFKLRTSSVGLTGLKFFTITKPFLLKVVNVVFTIEIVLLQSAMSPNIT